MDQKVEDGVSTKETFSFGLKSETGKQCISESKKGTLHSLNEEKEI